MIRNLIFIIISLVAVGIGWYFLSNTQQADEWNYKWPRQVNYLIYRFDPAEFRLPWSDNGFRIELGSYRSENLLIPVLTSVFQGFEVGDINKPLFSEDQLGKQLFTTWLSVNDYKVPSSECNKIVVIVKSDKLMQDLNSKLAAIYCD
jgi:hypothetical protein